MGDELREIMVYQSPPELDALWTEVEAMMKTVGKEQAGAIALEMKREREKARLRARKNKIFRYRLTCWSLTSILILY